MIKSLISYYQVKKVKKMKFLIKIVLIAAIGLFGLINLKAYSFDKGFSKTEYEEDKSIIDTISTIAGLEEVEYYKSSFPSGEYIYNVYLKTKEDCYLLKATQEDIDGFKLLGVFSSTLKPEKITPIPAYVFLVSMFVVLIIPFGRKHK